jgi:flagellar biosynthesis protein FlhF
MKIIRHTARDMRQAMRAVREQLGDDAVILSSRRTDGGVEVTAAVDFDAATLDAGGPAALSGIAAKPLAPVEAKAARQPASTQRSTAQSAPRVATVLPATRAPVVKAAAPRSSSAELLTSMKPVTSAPASAPVALAAPEAAAAKPAPVLLAKDAEWISIAARDAVMSYAEEVAAAANTPSQAAVSAAKLAVITEARARTATIVPSAVGMPEFSAVLTETTSATASSSSVIHGEPEPELFHGEPAPIRAQPVPALASAQAAAAIAASAAFPSAAAGGAAASRIRATRIDVNFDVLDAMLEESAESDPTVHGPLPLLDVAADAVSLTSAAKSETADTSGRAPTVSSAEASPVSMGRTAPVDIPTVLAPAGTAQDMGSELKTLRRMLETQLAHLAWNDLARRAPVRAEMLRELTEIGITHDLAEHLVRQIPEDQDLTFARRFTIAGLSQYLRTTGDRWLDEGGRVAFVGATGVGKTTTLAKIAVRWVLRHGPRNIALVAADSVRIGAQEQLRSLAQMLGVPVYAPEKLEALPALLERLSERLVLIDTPGLSVRDPQFASRLGVLASAAQLESALVLAASTQTGAIDECVTHFAPLNPACCVLTKIDEAVSLGGALSVLIQAKLPVSYTAEGQRVPEDLRPARALELVSAAVRLAKTNGAVADEDLLRRRFGKAANGII